MTVNSSKRTLNPRIWLRNWLNRPSKAECEKSVKERDARRQAFGSPMDWVDIPPFSKPDKEIKT